MRRVGDGKTMVIRRENGRYFVCAMQHVEVSRDLLAPGQIWRDKTKPSRVVHVLAIGKHISYDKKLRVQYQEEGKSHKADCIIWTFANKYEYVRDELVEETPANG